MTAYGSISPDWRFTLSEKDLYVSLQELLDVLAQSGVLGSLPGARDVLMGTISELRSRKLGVLELPRNPVDHASVRLTGPAEVRSGSGGWVLDEGEEAFFFVPENKNGPSFWVREEVE